MKKAIKVALNQAGRKHALVDCGDGTYAIYVLCANYAGHVRGGIAHTWRVSNDRNNSGHSMTLAQAEILFAKRVAGKRK